MTGVVIADGSWHYSAAKYDWHQQARLVLHLKVTSSLFSSLSAYVMLWLCHQQPRAVF